MPAGTRETLLDVAAALLDEGGVAAVTLREVGHRAGVSHNAPYNHFTSKAALLSAVGVRDLRRHHDAIAGAVARKESPQRVLREALLGYVAEAVEYPNRFYNIADRTNRSAELREAVEASYVQMVGMVRAAQAHGSLRAGDPHRLASLMNAVIHGATSMAATGHTAGEPTRLDATALIDDLLECLRPAPPRTKPKSTAKASPGAAARARRR